MRFSGIKFSVGLKVFLAVNMVLCMYGISVFFGTSSSEELEERITSNVPKVNVGRSLSHYLQVNEKCNCSKCKQSETITNENLGRNRFDNNNIMNIKKGQKSRPSKIGEDRYDSKLYQVPNIVHYIWYNTEPAKFQFHHMLSVISASKFIKPDVIYFHTDTPPVGEYWEKTKEIPELKIIKRNPPTRLFGEDVKPPHFYTSHSNVDRIKVLMEYGGIYLDFDVFIIKSFDDLRKHVCTIGYESETQACGSIIVCSKKSFFLYLWMNSYFDDYRTDEWAYNTGKVPFKLANRFPHLVHVEKTKLNRPNFKELDLLYGDKTWDWKQNYAVHTWYRLWKTWSGMFKGVEPDMNNIKTQNNTFGKLARRILYNSTEIHSI